LLVLGSGKVVNHLLAYLKCSITKMIN
jgi:hypothetical protein